MAGKFTVVKAGSGAGQRWLLGRSLAAVVVRMAVLCLLLGISVVCVSTGIALSRGNNAQHGSEAQAVFNAYLVGVLVVLSVVVAVRQRLGGRSHREFTSLGDKLPYDKWLLLAAVKPWLALLVLGEARVLVHFHAPGSIPVLQDGLYALAAVTVIWLFVVGPIWRPVNGVLILGRSGFLTGRSWTEPYVPHIRPPEDHTWTDP